MYLEPGDVVVPTAIESHIANAHYHCVGSHYARPTYILEVDKCTLIVRILLFYGRKKSPALSSRAFLYLEPGDVVVLTAIESHIANATLSFAGARLRAVLFEY